MIPRLARLGVLLSFVPLACSKSAEDKALEALSKTSWSIEQIPAFKGGACPAPPAIRDLSTQPKIAVAVYHFNVQYAVGGLVGFPDNTLTPTYNLNEAEEQDLIIRTGLEPLLDLYLAHPSFHADIELQGLMLEVIAQRHPDVLEKMRALAASGQIDFDSFHYSDELFVIYPAHDLEVSIDLVDRIFSRVCLPKGRTVFAQEGQFARGELPIAKNHGYAVAILAKNHLGWQMGEAAAGRAALYEDPETPGQPVLIGARSWTSSGPLVQDRPFQLVWTFMDDGELALSKNRANPFFGRDYQLDPRQVQARVDELTSLEQAGFVHATIAEAAAAMRKIGVAPERLPPVFDGNWQPKESINLFRWMGGGGLFHTYERDSDNLSAAWNASALLRAAERAAKSSAANPAVNSALAYAWREALLSRVSDATGHNPWRNAVEYGNRHANNAIAAAKNVLAFLGQSPPARGFSCDRADPKSLSDLGVEVRSLARAVSTSLHACASPGGGPSPSETIHEISIAIPKVVEEEHLVDQTDQEVQERSVEVRFQRSGELVATLGLQDQVRSFHLDDYGFDSIGLGLPIGLAGLAEKKWVIEDMTTSRVAAIVSRTGPDRDVIRFLDDTVSRARASSRRFYVVEGADADRALALAHAINGG